MKHVLIIIWNFSDVIFQTFHNELLKTLNLNNLVDVWEYIWFRNEKSIVGTKYNIILNYKLK